MSIHNICFTQLRKVPYLELSCYNEPCCKEVPGCRKTEHNRITVWSGLVASTARSFASGFILVRSSYINGRSRSREKGLIYRQFIGCNNKNK